jgi:pilus assembly protein FimV
MGDTLGKIVREIDPDGHSLDQMMLALLRANPDAFIKGNINLIKSGAVLRMPNASELSQYNAREARAIVHEQIGQWREMRKPASQPAAVAGATDTKDAADDAAAKARTADARLEIVPPSSKDARQAGTRSGTQAGGEGDMLQELQQTKETLAARDAEVQDLKAQVAELEKLRQDQQQLIALKDSKLAQTQQALAARQAEAGTQAQQAATAQGDASVWPWAVGVLLVVALLAWLLVRRKSAAPKRPVFDTSRLAASVPAPATTAKPEAAAPEPPSGPATGGSPTWHAGGTLTPVDEAPPSRPGLARPDPQVDPEPARTDAAPAPLVEAAQDEAEPPAPIGHDRIELARAYIELGDVDTARGLLQEVADSGDAAARGEAARLLRDLV